MRKQMSPKQHREALIRRRIKFVVEKGAMARLFRKGSHVRLQRELFRQLNLAKLARIKSRNQYDSWLRRLVRLNCWGSYSRNGLAKDRWAYFAKLINIVTYEILSNRELFRQKDWQRIQPFLHVPIDKSVTLYLKVYVDPKFPVTDILKGMTENNYWRIQGLVRDLAKSNRVPPIWFEAAWSL